MDEILVTTDADYKDARPIDTVNRIKAILDERLMEDESNYISGEESIAQLK